MLFFCFLLHFVLSRSRNDLLRYTRSDAYSYSVRNDLTGLATAALIAWKLTVAMAIIIAINPASKNIHHIILIR